jgi:hypothetical protein
MTLFKAYFRIIGVTLLFFLCVGGVFLMSEDGGYKIFLAVALSLIYLMLMPVIIDYIVGRPKQLILGATYQIFDWSKIGGVGYYLITGNANTLCDERQVYFAASIKVIKDDKIFSPTESADIPTRFRVIAKYKPQSKTLLNHYPYIYHIEKA